RICACCSKTISVICVISGEFAFVFAASSAFSAAKDSAALYFKFMLKETLERGQNVIDQALEKLLPSFTQRPESIHQAMRHSVFAGGKRLRPILCMEAARMVAGKLPTGIEELGSALEMLHTYSL